MRAFEMEPNSINLYYKQGLFCLYETCALFVRSKDGLLYLSLL